MNGIGQEEGRVRKGAGKVQGTRTISPQEELTVSQGQLELPPPLPIQSSDCERPQVPHSYLGGCSGPSGICISVTATEQRMLGHQEAMSLAQDHRAVESQTQSCQPFTDISLLSQPHRDITYQKPALNFSLIGLNFSTLYGRGQKTYSIKGRTLSILTLQTTWPPFQLLNSATTVQSSCRQHIECLWLCPNKTL